MLCVGFYVAGHCIIFMNPKAMDGVNLSGSKNITWCKMVPCKD